MVNEAETMQRLPDLLRIRKHNHSLQQIAPFAPAFRVHGRQLYRKKEEKRRKEKERKEKRK
jgi:hypothetical protein